MLITKMFLQDLLDIGFSFKNCDAHVLVCFDYDVIFVVNEFAEGMLLKAHDVGP